MPDLNSIVRVVPIGDDIGAESSSIAYNDIVANAQALVSDSVTQPSEEEVIKEYERFNAFENAAGVAKSTASC